MGLGQGQEGRRRITHDRHQTKTFKRMAPAFVGDNRVQIVGIQFLHVRHFFNPSK